MYIKKIISNLSPPILHKAYDLLKQSIQMLASEKLFDGDEEIFKEIIVSAKTYAEYGCGASTIWVFNNTHCQIFSVDSSQAWLDTVEHKCGKSGRLNLHFANVGKIKDWGTPCNYENYQNFNHYTDWIWEQNVSPDVVLIDGRFRVACFLTSLLRAKEGTRLVFDDYTNREEYHIVEKFIKPVKTCGRQALFVVPIKGALDMPGLELFIRHFRFVFD
jgi:hypothetical protein